MLNISNIEQLKKDYPKYNKAGKLMANKIDWASIEVKGTKFMNNYGEFTFIKAERINGVPYWTIQQGNRLYTVTREQAIYSKVMPKSAIIVEVEVEERQANKPVYQLCLPQPVEPIDKYMNIITKGIDEYNKKVKKRDRYKTWNQYLTLNQIECPDWFDKLDYIADASIVLNICDTMYKELIYYYHPDRNSNTTDLMIVSLLDEYRDYKKYIV